MDYVACLKVGQNDVKALINLEDARKDKIAPLLELRGKETDRHLDSFLSEWGEREFFFDFCQTETGDNVSSWQKGFLLCNNAFSAKQDILQKLATHRNIIPVISWQDKNTLRNIIQFALHIESSYSESALRINMNSQKSWGTAISVLSAITNPYNMTVILDFQGSPQTTPERLDLVTEKVSEIGEYGVKQVVLLSTSFPIDKPPSGETRQTSCTDYLWQQKVMARFGNKGVVYGDYAATNPFSVMEFVPGMIVIPFACYFSPFEWWMRREGKDKEYKAFRSIAKEIISLSFFHGENYCWATKEISRISKLDDSVTGQHGTNGNWNGYKSNQHMCAMLDYIIAVGANPLSSQFGGVDEDEEE